MSHNQQANKAVRFRSPRRGPRLLLLPNGWDAVSARLIVAAGFPAIATTSSGVAWALGHAEAQALFANR